MYLLTMAHDLRQVWSGLVTWLRRTVRATYVFIEFLKKKKKSKITQINFSKSILIIFEF